MALVLLFGLSADRHVVNVVPLSLINLCDSLKVVTMEKKSVKRAPSEAKKWNVFTLDIRSELIINRILEQYS